MNTIILCEGKTDAVFLGYYLDKMCGFTHTNEKVNKQLTIARKRNNEIFEWYSNENDYLAIWGIGGKDCFSTAIKDFYNVLKKSSNELTYHQFVIVCDRDLQKDDTVILSEYSKCFEDAEVPLDNNKIQEAEYKNSFGQTRKIKTLAVIIPQDKFGALETALLDAIKEDEYDRKIVEKSESFVTEARQIADKYITSDRLELKAKLSSVFVIMSPEKVFGFIDDLLRTTVKWEEKKYLYELFEKIVQALNNGEQI